MFFFCKDNESGDQRLECRNRMIYRIINGKSIRKENETHYLKNGAAEIRWKDDDNGSGEDTGFSDQNFKNIMFNTFLPCFIFMIFWCHGGRRNIYEYERITE